jgi:hypothetical protein
MTVQNFEVLSNKFNIMGICTSESYAQEWILDTFVLNPGLVIYQCFVQTPDYSIQPKSHRNKL